MFLNAALESGLSITIYLNDGASMFFDIILVGSVFKWCRFFKGLYPSSLLFTCKIKIEDYQGIVFEGCYTQ